MTIKVELGLGCCDTFGDGERERELVLYSCHHPVMFHGNDYKPLSACHIYKDRSCILSSVARIPNRKSVFLLL